MSGHDPTEARRLIAIAPNAKEWDPAGELDSEYVDGWNDAAEHARMLANQLEAALAEIERLRPVLDAAESLLRSPDRILPMASLLDAVTAYRGGKAGT